MSGIFIGFLTSFLLGMLIVRFKHLHTHLSHDNANTGPQKFHQDTVPRIGGICLAFGLLLSTIFSLHSNQTNLDLSLLLASIPVFIIGFSEDISKKISIKFRLFFCAFGAGIYIYISKSQITHFDIFIVDYLFELPIFSTAITVFAITGLTNSYNIIDGFNGLSSIVGLIAFLAIAIVGFQLEDLQIVYLALSISAIILGFFLWNYPKGLVFLGDGGAYLIGFWVACLSIYMSQKYQVISPWFFFLINCYPIVETLFSIYRRKIHKGKNPGNADGIHFHSLIYRRVLKKYHGRELWISANSRTAPFLWVMSLGGLISSFFLWRSTPCMLTFNLAFIVFYIYSYQKIVRFQTPFWLRFMR